MKKVILLFLIVVSYAPLEAQTKKEILYVGTFSVRGSEGIYAYTFNRAKHTLTPLQTVPSLESPTYLAIHPNGKFLYSVNRGKAESIDHGGSVSAYGIDPATGRLNGLNHRSSYGDGPCYVQVDNTGKFIFVAHYAEGTLAVFSVFNDGLIGSPSDAKKYVGNGATTEQPRTPHIHAAVLSQDNKFLYVVDLGSDKIYIYEFNATDGTLHPAATPEIQVAAGAGPRQFAFHPSGNFAYVAEELTSSVGVFSVDKLTGALTVLQDTVKSLPENFTEKNAGADIRTDVSGKYLFMSNRGANTLSIFSIAADGKVTLIGHQNSGGLIPRYFLVDPKGEYVFVANQDSDTINTFRFNSKTGKLTEVGKPVKVPSPVCLKLLSLN